MYDEFIDPTNLLNQDTYDTIMVLLSDDDESKKQGLQILSTCLSVGNADVFGDFPTTEVGENLTRIMQSPDVELVNLSTQCVHMFLEAHPGSTRSLINAGALPVMKNILENYTSQDSVSSLLHSISIIGEYRPDELTQPIGILPLIKHFEKLRNSEKKCSLVASKKIVNCSVIPEFIQAIQPLINIIKTYPDYSLLAIQVLKVIIQNVDTAQITPDSVTTILDLSNTCKDGGLQEYYFAMMCSLTKKLPTAQIVADYKYDYYRIFDIHWGPKDTEVKRLFLNVIVNLLPNVELPDDFWMTNKFTLKEYKTFALYIKPLIIKLLVSRASNENLLISALCSTIPFEPLKWDSDLTSAIGAISKNKDSAPFVLLILITSKDVDVIRQLNAYSVLSQYTVKDTVKEWYDGALERLKALTPTDKLKDPYEKTVFKTPEDIANFVNKNPLSGFEFQNSSLLDKAIKVFTSSNQPVSFPDLFSRLRDIIVEMVSFAPLPSVNDALSRYDATQLVTKQITVNVIGPDDYSVTHPFNLKLDLGSVGFQYCLDTRKIRIENLRDALQNSKYGQNVIFPQSDVGVYFSQITNVLSDIHIDGYPQFKYMVNSKGPFSPHDQLFTVLAQTNETPDKLLSDSQKIEIQLGTCDRSSPNIPDKFEEQTQKILQFARSFYQRTGLDLHKPSFDLNIRQKLSSPLLTMGFFSPQSRIIYHYPFLFSFETRVSLLRTAFVDLDNNQAYVRTVFNKLKWNDRTEMRAKIIVRRSHILEDGLLILKDAGPGCLRWDATWDGEEGIGSGPTKEFIQLLAKELCKNSLGLWRDNGNGEYAQTDIGLFPKPFVSDKFWEIGCLCAKALLMDMPIDVPFSNQFFAAIIGLPVTIEEVDPQLANALKNPEGLIGLPFDYPGTEHSLNPKHSEITKKNLKEYVEKVIDATVGSGIQQAIAEFKKGFSEVIQWEALKMFSPQEISVLICGESCNFTPEEFQQFVIVSHGYTEESPQIKMLFSVIEGFDASQKAALIQFITGCSKLPVGGLKNLQPQLTIARRYVEVGPEDASLPSVMTCTNYLKIPPYSTIDIMRERLLKAIEECPTSFLLT